MPLSIESGARVFTRWALFPDGYAHRVARIDGGPTGVFWLACDPDRTTLPIRRRGKPITDPDRVRWCSRCSARDLGGRRGRPQTTAQRRRRVRESTLVPADPAPGADRLSPDQIRRMTRSARRSGVIG